MQRLFFKQLDGVEQNGGELFLFFKGLTTIHITVNGKKVIFQGFVDHNPYYCKWEKGPLYYHKQSNSLNEIYLFGGSWSFSKSSTS